MNNVTYRVDSCCGIFLESPFNSWKTEINYASQATYILLLETILNSDLSIRLLPPSPPKREERTSA